MNLFTLNKLETEKVLTLKKCSKNNVYCKSMLGNMYYSMHQYNKAFELLIESQGDLTGYNGFRWAPSELALGNMYALGTGVKKNKSEAIEHFIKCALAGNDECISKIIFYEEKKFHKEKQAVIEHPELEPQYYSGRHLLYWCTVKQLLDGSQGKEIAQNDKIVQIRNIIKELYNTLGEQTAREWQQEALKLTENIHENQNYTRNLTDLSYYGGDTGKSLIL